MTFLEISFRFWSTGNRNGWFRSSAELAFQCLGKQRIEQTDLSEPWVKLLLRRVDLHHVTYRSK